MMPLWLPLPKSSLLPPFVKSFLPCPHPVLVVVAVLLLTLLTSPASGGDVIRLHLHSAVGRETFGPKGETETGNGKQAREEGVTQQMEGISGEGYFLNISVGTPPQQMQILVDTGSSNTALAASPNPHITQYFNRSLSSTYYDSGETIHVPYTQGEWNGDLGSDLVALTSLPGVEFRANMAFITQSQGFFIPDSNWQGIVGLAYQSIARPETLTPFWDSLRESSNLSDVFSMQLCGAAHSHNASAPGPGMQGNLVLGGVSVDLYTGDIFYTPIIKEMYYEVVITDMAVQGKSLHLDCKEYNFDKTIVDSGTTHLRLPTRVFDEVVKQIQNSLQDSGLEALIPSDFWTGDSLICWDNLTSALTEFPSLSISLLSTMKHDQYFTLQLTAQHYLRRVDNVSLGILGPPQTCLKLGISPSDSGSVIGAVLMESYYVVFDRENRRVGFADTTCPPPSPLSHIPQPHISNVHTSKANLTACQYQRAMADDSMLVVVSYVMGAVCLVCALPLMLAVLHWRLRVYKNKRNARRHPHDDTETVLTN